MSAARLDAERTPTPEETTVSETDDSTEVETWEWGNLRPSGTVAHAADEADAIATAAPNDGLWPVVRRRPAGQWLSPSPSPAPRTVTVDAADLRQVLDAANLAGGAPDRLRAALDTDAGAGS